MNVPEGATLAPVGYGCVYCGRVLPVFVFESGDRLIAHDPGNPHPVEATYDEEARPAA